MIENQKVKLYLEEALNKIENIYLKIQKNINFLNNLFILELQQKIKDNEIEDEILKKDKLYCKLIINLRGLKRVTLAKIRQKDLKSILTIHDFNYYEDRVIENLNNFKGLIYSKQLSLNNRSIDIIFKNEKLNDFYLNIINSLTALKGLFLSEIINDERRC